MTLEDWFKDPELIIAWRATWRQPHMAAGLDLLKMSICDTGVGMPPGTDVLTACAMRDAARQGAKANLKLIEAMGSPAPEGSAAPPLAYELVDEDDGAPAPRSTPAPFTKPKSKPKK